MVSVDVESLAVDWSQRDTMIRDEPFTVSDEQIKQAVMDAFVRDSRVWAHDPAVHVTEGVVT